MELIRAQKQSRKAKKNEPKNATSKGGDIKKLAPKLARNGPKIAPKIPPPTTNAVALFLAWISFIRESKKASEAAKR